MGSLHNGLWNKALDYLGNSSCRFSSRSTPSIHLPWGLPAASLCRDWQLAAHAPVAAVFFAGIGQAFDNWLPQSRLKMLLSVAPERLQKGTHEHCIQVPEL